MFLLQMFSEPTEQLLLGG